MLNKVNFFLKVLWIFWKDYFPCTGILLMSQTHLFVNIYMCTKFYNSCNHKAIMITCSYWNHVCNFVYFFKKQHFLTIILILWICRDVLVIRQWKNWFLKIVFQNKHSRLRILHILNKTTMQSNNSFFLIGLKYSVSICIIKSVHWLYILV